MSLGHATPATGELSTARRAVQPVRRHQLFHQPSRTAFWIWGSAVMAALGIVWFGVTALEFANPYFLPSPGAVWTAGYEMASTGQLWADTSESMRRIVIGFLISTALALPIGLLMGSVGRFEAALEPFIDFVRYMPAVAFVPLTIVWFGVDEGQKYSIIFIGTFFQQALMIMDNVKRTPLDYVRVGETLGLGTTKLLRRIVLPSSGPAIWDTLRISFGWAWTWLVVAELVAARDGLGQRIVVSQRYFDTDRIFFLIGLIGVIGLVLDQLFKIAGRALFRWSSTERG
ncbi:ABC transporter permease [Actinoplanes sp. NEAU-A12]|uniref:ABC transporter permease n=1 Tax=Actinoplanes sandaracinus TaxID=3045177 RepID=A0ABT6WX42_9ACTN|nr:ABC transporter permease [Actinoplanes sandaracinus]MDI6104313.1 ABC transporter permease [Actinoplanes sandaracinus]